MTTSNGTGEAHRQRESVSYGEHWRCLACGGFLERILANVGSLRCHECRSENRQLDVGRVSELRRALEAALEAA